MKAASKQLAFLISFLLAIPLAFNALSYANFDSTYGFLQLKRNAVTSGWYLPAYYAHVLPAALVLVIGLFQVKASWRQKWSKAHQYLGILYVSSILLLSGPGGIIMSFFIQRGPSVQASFLTQSAVWWYTTWAAYRAIRSGDIEAHGKWMFRSYSITFAAITLRVYAFAGSWFLDLTQPGVYATIAWASWTLNLVACEYLLKERERTAREIVSQKLG